MGDNAQALSTPIEVLAQNLSARSPLELDLPSSAQAAVALILTPGAAASTQPVLLILRSERADDPWSGHMALPGGRRDPVDRDLCATAVREAREETGVDLADARLLGRLDDLRPIRESQRQLAVRPFVFWLAREPALHSSAEVAATLWVPLPLLRAAAGEAEVEHRGEHLRVRAYTVEGRIVWGMTQRVLAALLESMSR